MSLVIWLPLNKDLRNNGLSNVTITNSGATINDAGKIGKSYYFNGSSHIRISLPSNLTSIKNSSVCAWVRSTGSVVALGGISNDTNYANAMMTLYTSGWQFAGSGTYKYINGGSIANSGVWHHVCCTCNDTTITTYLDGVKVASNTLTGLGVAVTELTSANFIEIGCDHPGGDEYLTGYVNDFRVYNHCLSEKEVKELAKGLIVHYPLNDKYCAKNLITNGFGQLGQENWTNNNISTTEVPSADTTIKASYHNANQTKEKILLNHNTTYTISAYFKTTGATTGSTYPSLLPYDVDDNFISTYNCAEGFSNTYRTTLAQPLKTGDTVIYATDLSAWTTGDNYYYHVAIFGYKDSFGRVYPDMEYTRDSPVFGTKTDKSHINKTNNTITLNAPYTGKDRPAGTVICQATEGSTYVYPFGGLSLSTLADWVFKSATLDPNSARLKYAKYVYYFTYYTCYNAGIKLVDNRTNNIIFDTSGNGYNGTPVDIDCSLDTARYSNGTLFANGLNNKITAPITIGDGTQITISVWMKSLDGSGGTGSYHMPININSSEFEFSIPTTGKFRQGFIISGSRKVADYGSTNLLDKKWHMISATFDGTNIKRYIDGVLVDTTAASGTLSTGNKNIYIGTYGGSTQYASKNILESDLRIYATALSADDIKELYQTAAHIDKNGTLFGYEFVEN